MKLKLLFIFTIFLSILTGCESKETVLPISEDLEIFDHTSGIVLLGNDNYEREYLVYSYNKFFDTMFVTKDECDGDYFNDFIYRVYTNANKDCYDEFQLLNGNEIHYHDEVYYIQSIDNFDPSSKKLLTENSMKLNEIIGTDEIKDVRLVNYINSSGTNLISTNYFELSTSQQEDILDKVLSASYYNFTTTRGNSGLEYSIELYTDNNTFTLNDSTGSMTITSLDTNLGEYTASFSINNLFNELDIPLLQVSKYQLRNISSIPLYNYSNDIEFEWIKKSTPINLTIDCGKYTELAPFTEEREITIYRIHDNELIEYDSLDNRLYIPVKSGRYIIDIKTPHNTFAGHFIIGDGIYRESENLSIFNPDDLKQERFILLGSDQYNYSYYADDFYKYFNSMVITKNNTGGYYFNDFDYRVYDGYISDKANYEVAHFRNGNEIHYNNEVYYVNQVYMDVNETNYELVTVKPIKITDILNCTQINGVKLINYLENPYGDTIHLTQVQQDALINKMLSYNFYDSIPTPIATSFGGTLSYAIEITTNNGIYEINDWYNIVIDDKNGTHSRNFYNANFRIRQLLRELEIIQ